MATVGSYNYQTAKEKTVTTTGNIDDLNLEGAGLLRMNNASLSTIRGLKAGYAGQEVTVVSIGAGQVDLAHQNAGSVAGNRLINLITTVNSSLAAGFGSVTYKYDEDTARWRQVGVGTFGQIAFPSTQLASTNPNTLDDYEEGTWTPVIGGLTSETGQTYGLQDGRYVKTGKWVSIIALVFFSGAAGAKGTITGVVTIKGLPFTSGTAYSTGPVLWDSLAVAKVYATLEEIPSTATMSVLGIAAASTTVLGGASNFTTADLGDSSLLLFSATYETTG